MSKAESNYSHLGSIFILIGGILAIIFSAVHVVFMLILGRALRAWIARPMVSERLGQMAFPVARMTRSIFDFMVVGAIVTIILGIIAIYAYTRVKSGRAQNGGLIAIIVGVTMLASTHWLMGILTLVGGILCYTSRKAELPASSPKSPPS